jgi:hypothetical protein
MFNGAPYTLKWNYETTIFLLNCDDEYLDNNYAEINISREQHIFELNALVNRLKVTTDPNYLTVKNLLTTLKLQRDNPSVDILIRVLHILLDWMSGRRVANSKSTDRPVKLTTVAPVFPQAAKFTFTTSSPVRATFPAIPIPFKVGVKPPAESMHTAPIPFDFNFTGSKSNQAKIPFNYMPVEPPTLTVKPNAGDPVAFTFNKLDTTSASQSLFCRMFGTRMRSSSQTPTEAPVPDLQTAQIAGSIPGETSIQASFGTLKVRMFGNQLIRAHRGFGICDAVATNFLSMDLPKSFAIHELKVYFF